MELFVVLIPIYALVQLGVFGLKGRWLATGFVPLFVVLATGIYQAIIGSGLVVLYVGVMSFYGIIFLLFLFLARVVFRPRFIIKTPYGGTRRMAARGENDVIRNEEQ